MEPVLWSLNVWNVTVSGFSCLYNDYERAVVCADTDADATDVINYVSTDAGNTPLEDVTDDKHAFYGWHYIKINPTEVWICQMD